MAPIVTPRDSRLRRAGQRGAVRAKDRVLRAGVQRIIGKTSRSEPTPTLEITLEDQTTFPALLSAETIPLPLAAQVPAQEASRPPHAVAWPGIALKLGTVALGVWALLHWW
jgi:hypothetical protein